MLWYKMKKTLGHFNSVPLRKKIHRAKYERQKPLVIFMPVLIVLFYK